MFRADHPPNNAKSKKNKSKGMGSGFFGFVLWAVKWIVIVVVVGAAGMAAKRWFAKRNAKRF